MRFSAMPIETGTYLTPYTGAGHQLVLEIYVSSLEHSISFYTSLGFQLERVDPNLFAQMSWEHCLLFLEQKNIERHTAARQSWSPGNLRIMVPDVDVKYDECKRLGYTIQNEIGDRTYALRDFIVLDPDGFGVRFGSYLGKRQREKQVPGPPNDD
jgi:catechol 2,3-dioxygenase-like lactoylglutathione lyase family enzyme